MHQSSLRVARRSFVRKLEMNATEPGQRKSYQVCAPSCTSHAHDPSVSCFYLYISIAHVLVWRSVTLHRADSDKRQLLDWIRVGSALLHH